VKDFNAGDTVDLTFTSVSSGIPTALLSGVVDVIKDNTTAESTDGVTLVSTFREVVGHNHVRIDTSANGTFYSNGSKFAVILSAGTVDGNSAIGYGLGTFSLRLGTIDDIADGTTANSTDLDDLIAESTLISAESTATAAVADGIAAGTTSLSTDLDDVIATSTLIAAESTATAAVVDLIGAETSALTTSLEQLTSSSSRLEATTTAIHAESTASAAVIDLIGAETSALTTSLEQLTSSSSRLEAEATAHTTQLQLLTSATTTLSTDIDDLITTTTAILDDTGVSGVLLTTAAAGVIWSAITTELTTPMPATPTVLDILSFQHMAGWNQRVTTATSGFDIIYNDAGSTAFIARVTKPSTSSFQRSQWSTST
jgi:hypothetical protein